MKKVAVLVIGLVLVLVFTASCGSSGVAQATYDKAVSDLTEKTAELQDITNKFNQANADITRIKTELAIFNEIFIPALTGELNSMSEADQVKLFQDMQSKVDALGDATIKSKFAAITSSNGGGQETMDFFLYLLQDMENTVK